jgi:hypothetical protein
MDFLSHLFLPLTAAYIVRRELFVSPWLLGLAGFGLLADFDKFLQMPGLLHSLVTLAPLCVVILATERWLRGEFELSPAIVALIGSHLLLDLLDGGPVPLLFPLVDTGIGIQYPVQTVFGDSLLGLRFEGPLVDLRASTPQPTNNTYGFIRGEGVASMMLFGIVYLNDWWRRRRRTQSSTTAPATTTKDES